MPNTLPPTTTLKALGEKKEIAARSSMTNYGFFLGASASNLEEILKIDPRKVPGVKLFIGSSTGNMAVDTQSDLEAIFRASTVPIMIHAEDDSEIAKNTLKMREKHGGEVPVWEHPAIRSEEACLKATNRALDLAARTGARLHIAHVSTAAELDAVERIGSDKVTLEVTPLHLTFSDEDYKTLGTRIKVNPAVKTAADREALRRAVLSGRITTIGSDHAPHLLKEKEGSALTAASGAPSVQFALPLLMDMFTPRLVVALYSEGPARLFGIEGRGSLEPGSWADVVVVEPCEKRVITDADVLSPCGWTPFIGLETRHKVNSVWVNGTLSLWDGLPTGLRNAKALKFDRSNN